MYGGGQGGGFSFAPSASSNAPAQTGFSFGVPGTAGTSGAPASGFSFGAPAGNAGTAPAPSTAAAPPAAGTGFSFGGFGAGGANPAGSTGGGGLSGFGGLGVGSSTGAATTTAATAPFGSTGFNFGAPPAAIKPASTITPAAPAVSGFSLGAQTTIPSAAPPALGVGGGGGGLGGGGFSFGGTAAAGGGLTGSVGGFGALGGGNISGNAKTTTLQQGAVPTPVSSTVPAGGLGGFGNTAAAKSTAAGGGGSLLGGLLSSTQGASVSAASTTTASTGFSLGGAATSAVPPASSAATGFSFGTSSLGQSGAPTTTTTASLGGGGLGLSGFATSTATSDAPTSTAVGSLSLPGGQKQMTFRQLEDAINKWTTELEDQEKCFLDQATQVNAWDRLVMENGEKIIQLNKELERVKLDEQKLDHELDFVNSQQTELAELLTPLEAALDELPPISHTQHAQLEREHTYTLAESLDSQLKRMSQDLKEIVERLNSTNLKPDDNDPLQQITKILNAHVVSLMWVDRNSANLQRRAEEIAKMMDLEKKEQERNFRMAYS